PPKDKNQRAFVKGSSSNSGEEDDEMVKNKTCLVAQASSELKEEALNEMLNNQKPFGEKLGLWFNSFEASSSGTKEIKFVKAQKKASSDGGPINMGGPLSVQAAPKANMGPPPATTPGSEKSVVITGVSTKGLPCCLSSSSVRCLENVEDPYEAIRQAYLVGTDTKSEPIEDPIETEAPESPHTIASPILLPDSTPPTCHVEESEGSDTSSVRSTSSDSTLPLSPDHPLTHTTPTLVPILRRTTQMAVRVLPVMSPDLSTSVAEVAAMSNSAFRKRFRSSYESLPSSSPPDLPLQKRYWGTSNLAEDDDEEEDDEEEDEEMEESSNFECVSEDAKDEGHATKDEDLVAGDEGLAAGDEGPSIGVESLSLGGNKAVPRGQQRQPRLQRQVWPTLTIWMDPKDGIVYIDVPVYPPPVPPAQTPPSPEWSSGLLLISPAPSIELSPDLFKRYDKDIGELFTRSGAFLDEIFSQRYRFRSQTDAQRAGLWHAISDTQGENQELRLQLTEERRARLELAEIVDSIRRGQGPREDV
ncbi:hypothetical protein Tco_0678009, partial [Tanacetum coccineum]